VDGLVDIVSSPIYSTAVGLVLYGHYNRDMTGYFGREGAGLFGRTAGRVSRWLSELF
jgi:cell division ATPase FtsA